ncbi:hypothetical protein OH687_11890 [Burkholderia anthina]|nr:hypothetical protein OH687_11890 [Burkholderia anthina]
MRAGVRLFTRAHETRAAQSSAMSGPSRARGCVRLAAAAIFAIYI